MIWLVDGSRSCIRIYHFCHMHCFGQIFCVLCVWGKSKSWVCVMLSFVLSVLFSVELCWYLESISRNLIAQFQREETQLFVLRVMVGLVILYDHVHPQGAFVKASNVDVSMHVSSSDIILAHTRYLTFSICWSHICDTAQIGHKCNVKISWCCNIL
jgi:hypothetical protein